MLAQRTEGRAKICRSRAGCGTASDRRTNQPTTTTPAASTPIVRTDNHAHWSLCTMPRASSVSDPASSRIPTGSGKRSRVASRDSGSRRSPRMRAPAPTGTLARNTARQSHAWTRRAAAVGPTAAARAAMAPQTATATGTRAGGKTERTTAREAGTSAAAPRAWITRKATSRLALGAKAQSTEASVKATRPIRNTRRRPNRSAIRPDGTRAAASAIVYADNVQDIVAKETAGKLARMSSKATKRTWVSRNTMKAARLATASTAQGLTWRGSVDRDEGGGVMARNLDGIL